ncbi:hypothetical protein JQ633_07080 [Bradyrhizobium tropiciagri]|uniref:hypothetical protein n=1 Tax=Bradyrhizobium tropiciagri TaxID=312253 RepID=UPI001BAA7FB6|nr:hypothetical protein [Bradyrhizobium tropiciagri]MBR0870114.1 hypothetical protein [Bradyrhizobium tropiciagri]
MTGDRGKSGGEAESHVKDSRQDRLKLALRENLKRRKSQARGRDDAAASELRDPPPDGADGDEPGR